MSPRVKKILDKVSSFCCIQTKDAFAADDDEEIDPMADDPDAAAFLRRLAGDVNDMGSGYFSVQQAFNAASEDRQLCVSLARMLQRHKENERTEAIIRDWRRLA